MKYLLFSALLGLGLAGCSPATPDETTVASTKAAIPQLLRVLASEPPLIAAASTEIARPTTATQPSQTVIYEGEMDLAVDSFDEATNGINQLLQKHKSYLSTAHETRANGQHRQEMTVKVPPEEFSPLVAALSKLGRIDNKDVASTDVTANVLQVRFSLGDKQIAEAKYQQLLAKATNPAEAHRLEEQVRQLHQDLTAGQAHLQQIGASSKWATLTLRYFQEKPDVSPSAPAPGFAVRYETALYDGCAVILEIGVGLTTIWPLLLLGGLGGWLVRRWHSRQSV